jgi:hypothetical protein
VGQVLRSGPSNTSGPCPAPASDFAQVLGECFVQVVRFQVLGHKDPVVLGS